MSDGQRATNNNWRNSNWNNNAFRGYRDQNNSPERSSWGNFGRQEPGGFTQASSWRGQDSFSGSNGRWGSGNGAFNRFR
jgi:hypothetical protein